ncbi:MAG: EF-hand domain-containing protein [Bradyrhizobium sp.]|nr:MAG: EF-hand domain-containing protein [Bradyrhizobium sp.]
MSISVAAVGGSYAPQAMTGASPSWTPAQKMSSVFSKIDTAGTGSITQSQLAQAFSTMKPTSGFVAMGPSAVFSALDTTGSGSVNKQQFVQGMTQLMAQFRAAGRST